MNVTYSQAGVTVEDANGNTTFLWWGTLDKERNRYRFANSVLVKFYWDFGCMGEFYQDIILDKAEWSSLRSRMLGQQIYFGEIAGKHSEIYGVLEENEITEVDDLTQIVAFFVANGPENGNVDFIGTFKEAEEEGEYEE